MRPTSRDIMRKIFQLHFQGDSDHTVGLKLGIPDSTVSDILALLPESIAPLEDLSKDLKEQNLTVFEAKKGTQLIARLDDLDVSVDQLESFVESAEKMQTNPDYGPKKGVQAAMRLNDLEEETGKTYSETMADFEEKKDDIKRLETRESWLKENIGTLEKERAKKIAESNMTDKELAYNARLRKDVRKYDIRLSDVKGLEKYLRNMKETGGDPKAFVEFTKQHGSLEMRISSLRKEEQEHALNLKRKKQEEATVQTSINNARAVKADLDKQIDQEREKLATIRRETEETQQREKQALERNGILLKVEAEAGKIVEAFTNKKAEKDEQDREIAKGKTRLQSIKEEEQKLDNKNKITEHEIEIKLGIKDYVTQQQAAVANLKRERDSIAHENYVKKERLALADTITDFLIRQPSYDFNRFYSNIQLIKKVREPGTAQPNLILSTVEEETRLLALKVFQGDLVPKKDYEALSDGKQKCDKTIEDLQTRNKQLESKLQETSAHAESETNKNQQLQALKVNFEGRTVTLLEFRNWVATVFNEEIQKRTDEKFVTIAAGTYGILDFLAKKIMGGNGTPAKGDQK